MHRSILQFTIYAACHIAITLARQLPGVLAIVSLIALLALCEHGSTYLHHLTH